MIELTKEQIAEGWIAVPPERMAMPPELASAGGMEWEFITDTFPSPQIGHREAAYAPFWDDTDRVNRIVAYRILKPATQAPASSPGPERPRTEQDAFEEWLADTYPSGDAGAVQYAWATSIAYANWCDEEQERIGTIGPNTPMLRRDERPGYDIDKMAGNGCIFGAPRVDRSPLLIVAPITATGRAMWGEQS